MNVTLKDFLAQRKAEIKAQIIALRKELQDIQAAEGVLTPAEDDSDTGLTGSKLTIQDMILGVLTRKDIIDDYGADALEIIKLIRETYGKEVTRPSISPALSRLKTNGRLVLDGKNWKLAAGQAQKNNAPEVGASDGVEAPSDNNSGATQTDDFPDEEIPF